MRSVLIPNSLLRIISHEGGGIQPKNDWPEANEEEEGSIQDKSLKA